MPWYAYVATFFGGAFLANALPHLIAGVSGQPFPTPFASPPFRGESPAVVNVAWALINLGTSYLLLVRAGAFDLRSWVHAGIAFAGFGAMALQTARAVARMRERS